MLRIELSELVVLGAQTKLGQLRSERQDAVTLRRRLADRARANDIPIDREAADQVRSTGWAR